MLSAERIKRGETNVKAYMFMCMVMAQVEAMEEGVPCDLRVAQSGRESLLFCRDLLRTWEGSISASHGGAMGPEPTSFNDGPEVFSLLDWDLDSFLPDTVC